MGYLMLLFERTFHKHNGRLLGLFLPHVSQIPFLDHRGELYALNEARYENILIGGKFSLYFFTICDSPWENREKRERTGTLNNSQCVK